MTEKEEYDKMDPRRFKRTIQIGEFELSSVKTGKFKNPKRVTLFARKR